MRFNYFLYFQIIILRIYYLYLINMKGHDPKLVGIESHRMQ
jgi:hypothetical protein